MEIPDPLPKSRSCGPESPNSYCSRYMLNLYFSSLDTKMKPLLQSRQWRKVLPITILLISVIALPAFVRTSSSALTVSSSSLETVVTYNLLSVLSPTPSYITVDQTALTLLGGNLPQNLQLVLSSSYNGGTPSTVLGCSINPHDTPIASCSFKIPFKGWGDYLLIGSVYSTNGTLLTQAGIDPLIEPEW
jgi:hypothetical protein